eukprot:TRINITY_DN23098_c0_g1_i1.p1 TRINITY_DN23098_c0_g1~~TRINITY_DN23098_c0_g1_i1.p1  ORF type:complete len:287 (-),score=65.39 TRINITY_DN23098_c0_g1_i1:116-976(-)
MTSQATTPEHQFDHNNFWKSQSMDTINQLLNGCQPINIPLTPIGSDIKTDQHPALQPSTSGSSSSAVSTPPPPSGSSAATGHASVTPQPIFHGGLLPPPSVSTPPIQQSGSASASNTPPATPTAFQGQLPVAPSGAPAGDVVAASAANTSAPSSAISVPALLASFQSTQLVQISSSGQSKELVKVEKEPTYVDVTPFLILPQHEAARRLGVPCSTLSKRWKEASVNRKWPYRIVCKLDKEITTLLKNVENSANNLSTPLSPAVEENLGLLLKKRQEELRTVILRIN